MTSLSLKLIIIFLLLVSPLTAVEVDVLYVKDAGTSGSTLGWVVEIREADSITWSDCETGAASCSNSVVLAVVKLDILQSAIDASRAAQWTYTVDDVDTPTAIAVP